MEQPVFLNATQMSSPAEGIDAVRLGATILPENPFVGLRPFESKEAVLFFGRRDQTKQLLSILHASRFVAVVGSSGCGKSSLIRAGLIPNLQAGFVAGNVDRWNIITMKPGNSPLQNLATALLNSFEENPQPTEVDALVENIRLFGVSAVTSFLKEQSNGVKTNFLLLVDQFEEIFRFAAYEDKDEKTDSQQNKVNEQLKEKHREEAADLVSIMLALVVQESIPVYVVMTMRSDFLGECDAFYGLPEAMNESQYLVPRLTRQQRQQAIKNPVMFYGAAISDRLTDRVLNDMEEARDQLPIMQHALMRTWEKWQSNKVGALDLSHYLAAGTVAEALSRDADDAMKGLSKDEHVIAERMFQALTTTDAKGRRLRRPTHLSELAAITGSNEVVLKLIDRFRDNNRCFLMLSADRDPLVDISHESLIRQWGTLRKWVDEEVTSRDTYLRLANEAVRYKAKEAALLGDPALQLALNWWSKRKPTEAWGRRYHKEFKLTEEFLKKSEKKRDDDALEAQRLQEAQAKREREDLEKAQQQAELEKIQAQELADARQRELQSKELLFKQRAKTIHRTRVLVVILAVTLLGVGMTAAWALRAHARAKASEAVAKISEANAKEISAKLEAQTAELKIQTKNAEQAKLAALNARDEAVNAKAKAEALSLEAKRQEHIANQEKAKVVAALQTVEQTALADKLRRKAANEQNAGELEDAQTSYLNAVEAYKGIKDTEGIAYTYSELGNMIGSQKDTVSLDRYSGYDHDRWDEFVKNNNWVTGILLGKQTSPDYFDSIGIGTAYAKGLGYYAEAINAYRRAGGESGLNGVAAVLERVGDTMSRDISKSSIEEERVNFANRQRAIGTRDSFCMALDNYEQAGNSKQQIALLIKMGDRLRNQKDARDAAAKAPGGESRASASADIGGCKRLGNDGFTYLEESINRYPDLLKKYQAKPNQFNSAQQAYVDLLIKVGRLYYQKGKGGTEDPPDQTYLGLASNRFNQAAAIFRTAGNIEKTVSTWVVIADGFGESAMKAKYLEVAAAEYHRLGKFDDEAAFWVTVAQRYSLNSRSARFSTQLRAQFNEKAILYLNQALSMYQKQGKPEQYPSIYAAIGEAQERRGAKDEATKAYEEVLRLIPNAPDNPTRVKAENALKRLRGEAAPQNEPTNNVKP